MSRTVKTFVIFDTETTGLHTPGNIPRITELCFIALLRDELLTKTRAPRVVNKLLLCFNPQKNINQKSSSLTGLNNDALEAYSPFKSHASLICSFLTTLPQPVCLVAHYGNGFDFPLIISELKRAKQPVPENILCVDSVEAFRELDGLPRQPDCVNNKRKNQTLTAGIENPNCTAIEETIIPNMFDPVSPSKQARLPEDGHQLWSKDIETPRFSSTVNSSEGPNMKLKYKEIIRDEVTNKAKRTLFPDQTFVDGVKKCEVNCSSDPLSINKLNNIADVPSPNTPQSPTNSEAELVHAAELAELNLIPELDRAMNVQQIVETPNSIQVYDTNTKSISLSFSNINNNRQKQLSYSLPKLYRRIFGQEPSDSHTAEGDCNVLLRIIQTKVSSFCLWCDQNAEPLVSLKPMY